MVMDVESLINSIELYIELEELKDIGLTEEEVLGYLEFFNNSWIMLVDKPALN